MGLLGFIEPCSLGTSLLFLQYLEGRSANAQVAQTLVFTLTRALFIGSLGAAAALAGSAFIGFQKGAWAIMGLAYVALGMLYLLGFADRLNRSFGPEIARLSTLGGATSLGLLFGLNIPACAAPLLAAILGSAALGGAARAGHGFVMLAAFGLALSLPIVAAVLWPAGRRLIDRLGKVSAAAPKAIGVVFVALGLWSLYFALLADV